MPGDTTFGELYRMLELYSPKCPPALLQQFVNNAYSRALSAYSWSALRGTGAFYVATPYQTGTVTMTNGSATVTGVGTSWISAAHAEKQLVVGNLGPFWDIATVDSPTQLTLTTPWVGITGSYTYAIQLIYLVMPTDFLALTFIADVSSNWWPLEFTMTQETIDKYDPRRTLGSTPIHVVEATVSPFTSSLNQVRYELWPRTTGEKVYFYRYGKRLPLLDADSDRILYPLRGDIVREGALADLSMFPGTEENTNRYYDPSGAQANYHLALYKEGLSLAKLDDQGMRPLNVSYKDEYMNLFPLPGSDWWTRNHIPYAIP